ncbi:hypothetical protein K2173_012903 (mitochondrion) [Erythroxylum novogranatense]|uniref:Uncharacterized protein n=1 Tax=Erythroxylum novogranatense TaxID=1862640 RepID=A0AAV8S443_9ROSI|nr:hypothetical protein K2173_012903 [Erythroxylum novogranatense]
MHTPVGLVSNFFYCIGLAYISGSTTESSPSLTCLKRGISPIETNPLETHLRHSNNEGYKTTLLLTTAEWLPSRNHLNRGIDCISSFVPHSNWGSKSTKFDDLLKERRSKSMLLKTLQHMSGGPPLIVYKQNTNPPDEKVHSALLLSRRTYPPRDSWNFYSFSAAKGEKEIKSNDCFLISVPFLFWYADTKSPLITNQERLDGRFFSWAAVRRSRGRYAPCPRRWVICSQKMLLQSDLAGERSQFAAENKTASERTFVRFFSTKHGRLRITVGRWLPKETPIRSAPRLGGIYLIPITRRGSP